MKVIHRVSVSVNVSSNNGRNFTTRRLVSSNWSIGNSASSILGRWRNWVWRGLNWSRNR